MSDDTDAAGTVFHVQTKFPFGDPLKGLLLRMVIQTTVPDVTAGEMMRILVDEKVLVGDHVQLIKHLARMGDPVEFKREPIAIAASDVAYLKPFHGKIRKPSAEEYDEMAPRLERGI